MIYTDEDGHKYEVSGVTERGDGTYYRLRPIREPKEDKLEQIRHKFVAADKLHPLDIVDLIDAIQDKFKGMEK